uniref:G-protein coupled receptors family 1 profile domain-containing protein n=1 Tax=Anopheles maculatus TaxID=74869 RepID=A0A182SXF2_9DIPT
MSVVITLFRSRRHRRSRVSLMICHLAVADLMVAFIMIPLEVGWRITVQWHAGNVACKVFLFMRAFCLYLSSNVLVCVSLDRCFAVIYPLRVSDARKRGKIMLGGAWFIAFVNAMPQVSVPMVDLISSYPRMQFLFLVRTTTNNKMFRIIGDIL